MRNMLRFLFAAMVCMLILPAGVLIPRMRSGENVNADEVETSEDASFYRVYVTSEDAIKEVPVRTYLIGAVAAEMPADYDFAALCAQTVASHTYAERMRMQNAVSPDPAIKGADFSDDSASYQAYYDDAQLRAFWGDRYAENYQKITDAVDAVGDLVLYYDNAPIVAAFHAVSGGQTESADALWGAKLPYLVSVSSEGDVRAPQYETVSEFTPETVAAALREIAPEIVLSDDPAMWFGNASCTNAGNVLQIAAGDILIGGEALRQALALRSACFSVQYDAARRVFQFTVRGYGHFVGMSQFGAQQMALSGAAYDEILLHYYPGTELRKL